MEWKSYTAHRELAWGAGRLPGFRQKSPQPRQRLNPHTCRSINSSTVAAPAARRRRDSDDDDGDDDDAERRV
ncbi:hypothetical protein Y032_0145g2475 [Ancylostoma ceylanicum]|uniref:Uncharacterized protein n=1 Tax=Ancylostoma ceylanicum TaxID=53326 RepID=A0A016T2T7_9BILA|nr:hypothetical protein Y032_0145g2475 [Ancylostoma ceylanicum]